MKFQSGILGVIVVVIALIGTVFGGYILNINSQSTVTTDYSDITDVSSLYSYTNQPDYIEYNPAKNFTGYKLSNNSGSGINFTQSPTINQYYMGQSSGYAETIDVSSLFSYHSADANRQWAQIYDYNDSLDNGTGWALVDAGHTSPPRVDFLTVMNYLKSRAPAGTNSITINIPSNSDINIGNTQIGVLATGDYAPGYAQLSFNDGGINGYKTSGTATQHNPQYYTFFRNYQLSATFQYANSYDSDSIVNVNFNNQYEMSAKNPVFRLVGSTQKQVVVSNVHGTDVVSVSDYPYWHGGNYTIEVVYSYNTVYYYMNPSQGVSINNPSNLVTTDWTNNKTNYQTNILFGRNDLTNSNTITTPLGDSISVRYNGTTDEVKVNSGSWIDIGDWDHFMLSIDGYQGEVKVIPVINFVNYQMYTLANYNYDIGTITKSPFTKLSWLQTSNSFTFSVASTMVEVTNKLFMVDPSLNIKNYFPLTEGFKIVMTSFTKLGDSFTINGQTFYGDENGNPIEDTGFVYFPNNGDPKTIKLGTMCVIEDEIDGHTYVQSNDFGAEKIDLGETTSSVISASGVWFFTNELYEGNIVNSLEYVWDWANNLTSTECILIWLGLIVVGSVVAHRFFDFKMLDFAIVVASSIILYCVLGVF